MGILIKMLLIILLFCCVRSLNFFHLNNSGSDSIDCGSEIKPCKTFEYIFKERTSDNIDKAVLIDDGYILNDVGENGNIEGSVYMCCFNSNFFLYGENYNKNEISTINIPDNCGHLRCEENVEILLLKFVSLTGLFQNFEGDKEYALIYGNKTGIIIKIMKCIFTTDLSYNYDSGSSKSKIMRIIGCTIIMENVIISNFSINLGRINGVSNPTSPIVLEGTTNSLTQATFTNINIYNIKLPNNGDMANGLFTGDKLIVNFESCFFTNIKGYRSLWRRFIINILYFCLYYNSRSSNVRIFCRNCIFDNLSAYGWGTAFDISTLELLFENCSFTNSYSKERGTMLILIFFFFFWKVVYI
jgi:hypothetical protein